MTDRVPGAELYRDDHLLVRDHGRDERVAVFVGRDPDSATPALTDAREVRDALDEFLGAAVAVFMSLASAYRSTAARSSAGSLVESLSMSSWRRRAPTKVRARRVSDGGGR